MDPLGRGRNGIMTDERPGGMDHLDFSNGQAAGFRMNARTDAGGPDKFRTPDGRLVEIRNVWADNLEREMRVIRELVERYPFVAMDTEFPGVVARPVGDFNQPDYQYQTLRCNVDMLKIIQLGLSFANEKGELPDNGCCTWQFNFSFNLSEDMYAQDSIQLLKNSGIDFEAHERRGIDLQHFGELLMTSGLVLMPNVTWLSFHSGYDFGYLLKLLTCVNLPQQEADFFDLLQLYFPKIYDIKFLVSSQDGFHGGLNKLAEDLKVERIGPMHQAGSDSLLTEQVFLKVADVFFNGVENLDKGKFNGKLLGQLYGYGGNQTGIFRQGSKSQHHNGGSTAVVAAAAANAGGNGNSASSLSTLSGAIIHGSSGAQVAGLSTTTTTTSSPTAGSAEVENSSVRAASAAAAAAAAAAASVAAATAADAASSSNAGANSAAVTVSTAAGSSVVAVAVASGPGGSANPPAGAPGGNGASSSIIAIDADGASAGNEGAAGAGAEGSVAPRDGSSAS